MVGRRDIIQPEHTLGLRGGAGGRLAVRKKDQHSVDERRYKTDDDTEYILPSLVQTAQPLYSVATTRTPQPHCRENQLSSDKGETGNYGSRGPALVV